MITTWEKELKKEIKENKDDYNKLTTTLTKKELIIEFDNDYGEAEGVPFTAWTDSFVYFPVCYDGSEWVGSAPRNPCNIKTVHQGGW